MKPLIMTLSFAQLTALLVMAGAMAFTHPTAASSMPPHVDLEQQTFTGSQR